MISLKGGHATGINEYFGVVGLHCMGGYDRIPLSAGIGPCLFWLDIENVDSEYWLVYMLGYLESDLRLVVGSLWDYGLPMQRCLRLLRSLHGGAYDLGWLDSEKLTDRFYELVFRGVWSCEGGGGE
jgi:hypothetical protein